MTSLGHLALATDAAYLPWCATAIRSAVRATGERPLVVHLLHTADVGGPDRDRLRRMVEDDGATLHLLAVEQLPLDRLPPAVQAHGGAVSCARLLLPEVLPQVDRLVYLDADTLTRTSLDELWTTSLDGAALGAVRNVVEPAMRERLTRLGVVDPSRYLNSGVLVMDLHRMREQGSAEALLQCVRDRGAELLWVDQDALNLVLGDAWCELHPRWNAQNSFWDWPVWAQEVLGPAALNEATDQPAVLHFEGPLLCKPWHQLCRHVHTGDYREALASTPWVGQPLTDRTAATRVIGCLPPDRRTDAYLGLLRWRRRFSRRS